MSEAQKSFVDRLTTEEAIQIFNDYEEYDKTGSTGNTMLRLKTMEYMKGVGSTKTELDLRWMDTLAHEVARRLTLEYLKLRREATF